jgi:hypothetical protein
MENNNGGIIMENVDGIEIKIDKKAKEMEPLPYKEWILVRITNITKQLPNKEGWHPSFNWEFTIQEEGFKNRKIWLSTSMLATLKSKLYTYYLEIMGLKDKDIEDGSVIKPSELIGKMCYIMVVESIKKPGKQLISDVKHYKPEKDDIKEIKEPTVKKEAPAKKAVEKEQKDEDESIDVENIDFDKL